MPSPSRLKTKKLSALVRPGGRIDLPPGFGPFKIGQRVYFAKKNTGIVMSSKPRGLTNGRMQSTRIRKSIRSWTLYGPRAAMLRRKSVGILATGQEKST